MKKGLQQKKFYNDFIKNGIKLVGGSGGLLYHNWGKASGWMGVDKIEGKQLNTIWKGDGTGSMESPVPSPDFLT